MTRYRLVGTDGRALCDFAFPFMCLAMLWAIQHDLTAWRVEPVSTL